MERSSNHLYEFGDFRFDPTERHLHHRGRPISLPPRAFDTLSALVRRSGHLVTKEELLKEVWQEAFVEESTLAQNIFTLRKVLSQYSGDQQLIETVTKLGYRFVEQVRVVSREASALMIETYTKTQIVTEEEIIENGSEHQSRSIVAAATDLPASGARPIGLQASVRAPQAIEGLSLPQRRRVSKPLLLFLVLAAVGITAITIAMFMKGKSTARTEIVPFERMRLSKITLGGKAGSATISPEGKHVAFVVIDVGGQSLWIKQVGTANQVELIKPSKGIYRGLRFSPDGNYVLAVIYPEGQNKGVLYRVPAIGGTPTRVLEDIDSPVSFSPTGDRFVFMRGYPAAHETALIIATSDGTNEQKIASRYFPSYFSSGPAWSPDGKIIACSFRDSDNKSIYESVTRIEVATRTEAPMTSQRWASVGSVAWTKSGEDLVLSAADQTPGPKQIWRLSVASGVAQRVTNGLTEYRDISLNAGADRLVAVQTEIGSSLALAAIGALDRERIISNQNDGFAGISWTPEGNIVYTSNAGGTSDIWIMDANGSPRQLTSSNRRDIMPVVTADGRYLLFASSSEGLPAHIWRANLDGSDPKQLTDGNDDRFPDPSKDGKWVVYSSYSSGKDSSGNAMLRESVWKIPITGGGRSLVADQTSSRPLFSPDGRLLAFRYQATPDTPWKFRVISFDSGKVLHELDCPATGGVIFQWAPDGNALTYVDTHSGVSNIWSQSLDGAPPKQLTNWESNQIFRFAWSPDGKRLIYVRGRTISDVVLIDNFSTS